MHITTRQELRDDDTKSNTSCAELWKILQRMDPALTGETFYGKRFLDYSALRKLFPASMDAQHRKLTDMLSMTVARLDRRKI